MLPGPVAGIAGLVISLVGPVLSFLASTHTILHRHVSKWRNVLVVGLTYATTCLSFAVLYRLIAHNDPHAFTMPEAEPPLSLSTALYFSVITISTTGYGDIAPFSGLARGVACWEIVTGVLFQVFIFSLLAGLLSPPPAK